MNPLPCPSQAYVYNGVVTKVIDGDTIDIDVDLGFRMRTTQRFRLVDVNAPEMHGPDRLRGLAARSHAAACLLGESVVIRTTKADDFGRWLARIWYRNDPAAGAMADFNAESVTLGYAVAYREGEGGV